MDCITDLGTSVRNTPQGRPSGIHFRRITGDELTKAMGRNCRAENLRSSPIPGCPQGKLGSESVFEEGSGSWAIAPIPYGSRPRNAPVPKPQLASVAIRSRSCSQEHARRALSARLGIDSNGHLARVVRGPQRRETTWSQFQIARVEARSDRAPQALVTFHGSVRCSRGFLLRIASEACNPTGPLMDFRVHRRS